jgi:hypothetical protein
MIYYIIYLTAIGLTAGDSSTVHICGDISSISDLELSA